MGRKKKGGDGHHGGAWKVAYADFVTAMMALFMVLWISAQEEEIMIATSQYFQTPFSSPMKNSSGVLPHGSAATQESKLNSSGSTGSVADIGFLYSLANEFYKLLNLEKSDDSGSVDIEVTSDGLRITLYDRPNKPLFKKNSNEFTEWGKLVVQNLAWIIERYKMRVIIDGHVATKPLDTQDPWAITTDQANAMRKALEHYAVNRNKIARVAGFGNTEPKEGKPDDELWSQRIEIGLIVNEMEEK